MFVLVQVYFRQKLPVVFEGDLTDEEGILTWLTSQEVFEVPGEIEEVNRKMLEKILEENEFVAVYFCELTSVCESKPHLIKPMVPLVKDIQYITAKTLV